MAEFVYKNAKNVSIGLMPFELNCGYHLQVSYKEDINPRSKFKLADKLWTELWELMIVCRENLYHVQEFHMQAHNKAIKPRSFAPGDKIWLNSKYNRTK